MNQINSLQRTSNQEINIYEKLKENIHLFLKVLSEENLFFQKIQAGQINKHHIALYVYNIMTVIQNTTRHMQNSIKTCQKNDMKYLEKFLIDRCADEDGHYVWAEDDLQLLNYADEKKEKLFVTEGVKDLIKLLDQVSVDDPIAYIAYNYLVEHLTAVGGPQLLTDLQEKCQISPEFLSVIFKHIEIDKGHASEDEDVFNHMVTHYPQTKNFLPIIDQSMSYLYSTFKQIAQV